MGDDDDGFVCAAQVVDAIGDHAERVDVEAGVGLVEDGEVGVEERHLENLVALFLAAGEALVHGAVAELVSQLHHFLLLGHQFEELGAVERVEAAVFAHLVEGGAHEVGDAHTGDLHRVLETDEDTFAGAVLNRQIQQVLAFEPDISLRHFVAALAGDGGSQRAFSGAVRAHNGVHFPRIHLQIHAFQYLSILDGYV